MSKRKSEEEVKKRIKDILNRLKVETDKEERCHLSQLLSHFRHYDQRLANAKKARLEKKKKELSRKKNYTELEYILADEYNKAHPIKFVENEKTKKVIPEREIIHKCNKCHKPIKTQHSYTTLSLMTQNIYYCEKCKTNDLMKVWL